MTETATRLRDLFSRDVTRAIPPVVYFHEQQPAALAAEVGEYIVTGGYPEDDPRQRRVPDGIHEQLVRLLRGIHGALGDGGNRELPASWISGFYGSGKSSFAKLLGLALDGARLPDGSGLAEALIARDTSPRRDELDAAWQALTARIDPIAAVFDIGSAARDADHIHDAALRQLQVRLGYCPGSGLVAGYELRLERDGRWPAFLSAAQAALGRPWAEAATDAMAEEHFSAAMHRLDPETYVEPMSWFDSHVGGDRGSRSVADTASAIEHMLAARAPGKTLFFVVDEVSQYIFDNAERMLKLQSFVSALGQRLQGRVWLLATGQQKLDQEGGQNLAILQDRFPPALRVHLSATNIRDVVHRRLLHKSEAGERRLRALYREHRTDLKLNAFGCDEASEEDVVEVYPLLPGQIELLMEITSALRARSARAAGDQQAIRGLLQLMSELFRQHRFADEPVGRLLAIDRVYDVQQSSLDAELQQTIAQLLNRDVFDGDDLALRVLKAVALLEQVQDKYPTTADLVARCLYDEVGAGSSLEAVTACLQRLVDAKCLSYTERTGYRIQSAAGQDWMRERDDLPVTNEQIHDAVRARLADMASDATRPRWKNTTFPWHLLFTDRFRTEERLTSGRDETVVTVDFRFLTDEAERRVPDWIRKSDDGALKDRIVWVSGPMADLQTDARALIRSERMVDRYQARRSGLSPDKARLLAEETYRREELERALGRKVARVFMDGRMYFRAQDVAPSAFGQGFGAAVEAAAARWLPDLYPYIVEISVAPGEWPQLLDPALAGVSTKFMSGSGGLGLCELDGGQTVCTCPGTVPNRLLKAIEDEQGLSGQALLARFGGPPYGYAADVVRACLVGLLRAEKIRLRPAGQGETIASYRDPGTRDLFASDRALRQADILPAGEREVDQRGLNAIRRFFDRTLGDGDLRPDREALAEAAFQHLPPCQRRLDDLKARHRRLPGPPPLPAALEALGPALAACLASRAIVPIVTALHRHLDALRDGIELLGRLDAELTDDAVAAVVALARVRDGELAQLAALPGGLAAERRPDAEALTGQLAAERPWRDRADAEAAADRLKRHYAERRRDWLGHEETEAAAVRARIKTRSGFDRLTADETNQVLRPIARAAHDTPEDALAPSLQEMRSAFPTRLAEAETEAEDLFDRFVEARTRKPVVKVQLALQGREIETEEELQALLREIEAEIREKIARGVRVRLR